MPPARRSTRAGADADAFRPYARADRRYSPDQGRSSASVARPANGRGSLRLTVKAPPSKLRQATSGSPTAAANPYAEQSESDATPQPPGRSARSTRNTRTVIDPDTDEDDEDDEEEEEEDDENDDDGDNDLGDEEDEDEEVDDDEDDEDDEEDSEVDEDEDAGEEIRINHKSGRREDSEEDAEAEDDDMEDVPHEAHPPPPVITTQNKHGRPSVTVTAPDEGPLKSVEAKEMEDEEEEDDDDEELSDLDSNENEGEDGEGGEDDEDDDMDEDGDGSRSATPDLSKLTRRQRAYFDEPTEGELMALSNEAQKKKHLTAEEHAMRRAEMARRRKNLSEKRNEEEKMDTINKLLKKPAPKRRTRQEILAAQQAEALGTPGAEYGDEERPDAGFVRWVHSLAGSRIGVPQEWLDTPAGDVFQRGEARGDGSGGSVLVEEVS